MMKEEKVFTHESFATLQFSRQQCSTAQALFGSKIKHSNTIVMEIKEAEQVRSYNGDNFIGHKVVCAVEMSETQFAQAITSMNIGTGVPVTLRYLDGTEMERPTFENMKRVANDELHDDLSLITQKYSEALEILDELLKKDYLNKQDKENLRKVMSDTHSALSADVEYARARFSEAIDDMVTESKGEIEAFYKARVSDLASGNAGRLVIADDITELE